MPDPVASLVGFLGITPRFARRLAEAGVEHPADLAEWQPQDLDGVRQLGKAGKTEVLEALERRLGLVCERRSWTPPPPLLRDPERLDAALAEAEAEEVALMLGVHPDAVTTWVTLHACVPEEESVRERRPESVARARAILDAGIPITERRMKLLSTQVEHPDWTLREIARHLGWTRSQVYDAWARTTKDHPAEVVEEYARRRGQ